MNQVYINTIAPKPQGRMRLRLILCRLLASQSYLWFLPRRKRFAITGMVRPRLHGPVQKHVIKSIHSHALIWCLHKYRLPAGLERRIIIGWPPIPPIPPPKKSPVERVGCDQLAAWLDSGWNEIVTHVDDGGDVPKPNILCRERLFFEYDQRRASFSWPLTRIPNWNWLTLGVTIKLAPEACYRQAN